MKKNPKENQRKSKEVDVSDDSIGENTEQTPLANEADKDRQKKKNKEKPKGNG